ncbi:MAG TPA: MFS transporter, partial [Aggregatilineales bacterium]|nr:MFS transporter [Aggregatilineales bacterium]
AIDVVTALLAVLPLLFIFVPQPEQAPGKRPTVLADMVEGLRFVWAWPGLVTILVMVTMINLLISPAFSLLPLMVTEHFGGGALELASLQSAEGIGMIVGGVLLGIWGGFRKRILTALVGLVGLGLSLVAIGLVPGSLLILAVGAMFVTGLMMPIVNGTFFAVLQATVPPEMQGRVLTLTMAGATAAATLIGLPIAGPVSDVLGVPTWFVAGGVVTALMGVVGVFLPAVMKIEEQQLPAAGDGPALEEPSSAPAQAD